MRIVSYNIRFGGERRVPYLIRVLASLEPDLVLLQEATNPSAVDAISLGTGLPHALRRPGWSVAALSREAVGAHEWHRPPRGRGFLALEPAGADGLRLVNVHLAAGLSRRGEGARLVQVADLIGWLGGAADSRTLLVGDLNAIAPGDIPHVAGMPFWLRMLLRFDGGFRTDVHTRLAAAGWIDAFRHLSPGDPGATLPAGSPQVRLDYALVPAAVLPRVRTCVPVERELAARASDHLPMLTVIDAP